MPLNQRDALASNKLVGVVHDATAVCELQHHMLSQQMDQQHGCLEHTQTAALRVEHAQEHH